MCSTATRATARSPTSPSRPDWDGPRFPWCAKTGPIGLRGLAKAKLEHAAEPRTARDRACADRGSLGRDELVAQTLVRPLLMIMLDNARTAARRCPSPKPQVGFSVAIRTMSAAMSGLVDGRPGASRL